MISKKLQKKFEKLVKQVPKGKVTTYGALARKLKIHPRTVAMLLRNNNDPVKIPCYRVIHSDGTIGGYSKGVKKKLQLLRKDRIKVINGKIDLKKFS